ncbi:hypothetical protein D3C80_1824910 [compost metagenome]
MREVDTPLDVLAFHGEEHLSQPFIYSVDYSQLLPEAQRFPDFVKTADIKLHGKYVRVGQLPHTA